MKELSFDIIYKKLQKNERKKLTKKEIKSKEFIDALLNKNEDYLASKVDKEDALKNHEVKMLEKKYGDVTYGAYMHKNSQKNFTLNDEYQIIELPDKIYYSASMVIIKDDKNGTSTIDNILAIRDKNKDVVQERYDQIVNILNNYSENQILELVNIEIDAQK